jgi:hypothetical protein
MDNQIAKNHIDTARKMIEGSYISLYHEECTQKINSGEMNVCNECQKIISLKTIVKEISDTLNHAIERMETSDLCLCEKRGKDIVCQYDEFFKIGDAFFDVINSKYIQLIEDDYWLMEQGKVEEAKENREAVDKIFKAIDDYAEFRSNKFHSYQRISDQ